MKAARTFIIIAALMFVAMMFIEMATPRHFVWKTTFTHRDDQPFGAALFDSVMAASLPQGYTTTTLTLSQLETAKPADERHVYLIVTSDSPLSPTDEVALMHMLQRGDQFLIASGLWQSDTIEQVLRFKVEGYAYPWSQALKRNVLNHVNDTLQWSSTALGYDANRWIVPDELVDASVCAFRPSPLKPLVTVTKFHPHDEVWDEDTDEYVQLDPYHSIDTIAGIINFKRGRMLIAACPLVFTNYGVLCNDGAALALRMLSQLEHYPVVRLDPMAKTADGGANESPTRYIMSQPATRWAGRLLAFTVLLAMIFTARRRQRVIPVIKPPVNRALEMVKHIGSLYFHRHDNADLLTKKYQFFVEEVRRLTMIDLDDENHIDDAYLQLQHASGIPRDELKQQLQNIVGWTAEQPTDSTLMRCIDYLNHVLSKLK